MEIAVVSDSHVPGPRGRSRCGPRERGPAQVDGVRLLDPGSVTGTAPADHATMVTATVGGDEVDVAVHDRA